MSNHIAAFRRRQLFAVTSDVFATLAAAVGLALGVLAVVA